MDRRKFLKHGTAAAALGGGLLPMLRFLPAEAAGRKDTMVIVTGYGPNSMDIHRKGTNRPAYQIAVNLYDRLIGFGTKNAPDGSLMYDYSKLTPELAESWQIAEDGMSVVFNLRKDATFWDGSPVTADDVKWSLDRAVSVGGFPSVQMKAGVLINKDQFEVVDAHTFRVKFIRKSKLTLPDLAVPVPVIINSRVAKQHVTEQDPWATEYLHKNPAGGGAYMLERWDAGQQTVYKRFDNWKSGPLPAMERVIVREVPSPSTRRALVVRGDVDVSLALPPKDTAELQVAGKLTVVGTPIENCMHALGLNLKFKPFQDKRVRQAVAYALPYDKIFKAAAYERGVPMWGGKSFTPKDISWPQPFPYDTDLDKAKALLKEAGYESGFEVPMSFNLGLAQWQEPTSLLIQEGLAKVGIKTPIDKVPGASFRTKALVEKDLMMHLKTFGGWLNYPDYYFFWAMLDKHLFNSMNYRNEEIEKLVPPTLDMEVDDPVYIANVKRLITIFFDEVPMIPIYQPSLDVAMQKHVEGYKYYFHRILDARWLKKA
tara:strand:- start:1709 stop:3331 length:1623 start_codon:yes stop_codon:yes gene_type:complete